MIPHPAEDRFIGEVGSSVSFEVAEWRKVDRLVRHLKKNHGGRVETKAEGPDARTFVLSVAGGRIVIYQWDTDDVTALFTPGLKELAEEIRARYGGP